MTDTNPSGVSPQDLANALPETDEEILFGKDEELPEEEGTDDESATPETDEQDESEPDDGFVEAEYEGKTYKVPKELKDALLRQSDYTRKTQEIAETRKQVEAHAQQLQAERQFVQQNLQEVAAITAIDQQLSQFAQLDWNALTDADPAQAMKLDRQMRDLHAQREQIAFGITQKQAEFQQRQQQEAARQLEEGRRVLEREIPGWGAERAQELFLFGKQYGIPEQLLGSLSQPVLVKALHDLQQYHQLKAKATTKPKAPVQEKPVTRITASKAQGSIDPDKMNPDQWLKWRESQLRKRK